MRHRGIALQPRAKQLKSLTSAHLPGIASWRVHNGPCKHSLDSCCWKRVTRTSKREEGSAIHASISRLSNDFYVLDKSTYTLATVHYNHRDGEGGGGGIIQEEVEGILRSPQEQWGCVDKDTHLSLKTKKKMPGNEEHQELAVCASTTAFLHPPRHSCIHHGIPASTTAFLRRRPATTTRPRVCMGVQCFTFNTLVTGSNRIVKYSSSTFGCF
jgi:hypothetical protein